MVHIFFKSKVVVEDVNDNAPVFRSPTYIKVKKNTVTKFVKTFSLDDPDDWSLGHGPPFGAQLDPRIPSNIADSVDVSYNSGKYCPWMSVIIRVNLVCGCQL